MFNYIFTTVSSTPSGDIRRHMQSLFHPNGLPVEFSCLLESTILKTYDGNGLYRIPRTYAVRQLRHEKYSMYIRNGHNHCYYGSHHTIAPVSTSNASSVSRIITGSIAEFIPCGSTDTSATWRVLAVHFFAVAAM